MGKKGNTILLVDDEERVRRILARYLAREGFAVIEAGSGEEMRERLGSTEVDLVILDLMLPDVDGITLARELRARSEVPIIMLTGKVDTIDRVVGLEVGADDYVTKPFDQRELLARVRSVLRRYASGATRVADGGGSTARFAGYTLDLVAQELSDPEGRHVPLTSSQYQLLAALVVRANRVLSREEIKAQITGRSWHPMDRSVDVMVGKLRRKLERDPDAPTLIKTVRGMGYKLAARVDFS